jgi:hypothetical protein
MVSFSKAARFGTWRGLIYGNNKREIKQISGKVASLWIGVRANQERGLCYWGQ